MLAMPNEEKKVVGMKTTEIKQLFGDKIKQKEDELISAKSVVDKPLDLTLYRNSLFFRYFLSLVFLLFLPPFLLCLNF